MWCLLGSLGRPAAGDDVVGGHARFQVHQVTGHRAELARTPSLHE